MKPRSVIAWLLKPLIVLATVTAFAAEAKFEATVEPDKIAIGETAKLSLTFYGTQSMPAPDIDRIDGLEVRYLGPSTMMTVLNGQVSTSITHMYSVQPLRTGTFQLGPFKFQQRATTYVSGVAYLEVSEERSARPAAPRREETVEKIDLGDRMFLTLESDKVAGYVNELIPVTVRLYVNRMNVNDIQMPSFEQEEFSKVAFKEPKQYRKSVGGVLYDILEFNTSIFATKPGEYTLGPAKVKCNVMLRKKMSRGPGGVDDFFGDDFGRDSFFDDFYTRYERHPVEVKSKPITLVIQQLPAQGVPKDFAGSVGDYQFILSASPTKVKVGDPITLTISINGRGNFNTVIAPKIENLDGFRVYEPQIKTGENTKEFKQVLIPESDRVTKIPALTFPFFDPYRKEYRTITQGPIPITVEKGKDEAPSQVVGPAAPAANVLQAAPDEPMRDIIGIKESPGRWRRTAPDAAGLTAVAPAFAMPALALAALYAVQRRRDRLKTDSAFAGRVAAYRIQKRALRQLRHLARGADRTAFYEKLFQALQDYIGNRLAIPTAGITQDVIDEALAARGVDIEIVRKLRNLFVSCDHAKFARQDAGDMKVGDDLKEFAEIIGYFERVKL